MSNLASSHWHMVRIFMEKAGQQVNFPVADMPNQDTRRLRARLILEEAFETVRALGFGWSPALQDVEPLPGYEPTSERFHEVIDGCCDLRVVTTGTLIACGVPDDLVQQVVDLNNLDKFGPGHEIRDDGKLVKPANHRPPNFAGALVLAASTPVEAW